MRNNNDREPPIISKTQIFYIKSNFEPQELKKPIQTYNKFFS